MKNILEVEKLTMMLGGGRRFFGKPRPAVRAVDGVDLSVGEGEILGIVGNRAAESRHSPRRFSVSIARHLARSGSMAMSSAG